MFLCATSSDSRIKSQTEDFAAVFTTNLQEPILLQNFTIELVSAIITCEKNIKITDTNSVIAFRVGAESVAEQYTIKIPTNTYRPDELAVVLADAILDVIPVKGWEVNTAGDKFASCAFDRTLTPDAFVLKFTKLPQNNQDIRHYRFDMNSYGYEHQTLAHTANTITLKTKFDNEKVRNNEPIFSQNVTSNDIQNKSGSVVGLDVGNQITMTSDDPMSKIKGLTYTGFDDVGIAEQGGLFELEIAPQRCSISTSYNKNIGGDAPNTAPYFVIEDRTAGTPYDSLTWEHALLNPNSKSTIRTDTNNNRYVSGILLSQSQVVTSQTQGSPYNQQPALLSFPVNQSASNFDGDGKPQDNLQRQEKIRSTWNNSFRMMRNVASNYGANSNKNSFNEYHNRGFNLVIDETGASPTNPGGKAVSSLALFKNPDVESFELFDKEPLEIRLAINPLIQGGFQTSAAGTATLTIIKKGGTAAEDILVNTAPTPQHKLRYILGSVGQFNSFAFGVGSTKVSASTSGGSNRRLPYYKITAIDGNDQPTSLVIVDGGENIVAGQELVLNDPATFVVERNLPSIKTEAELVDGFCAVVTPLAANIGQMTAPVYTTRFQYLPTSVSVVNDMIFGAGKFFDDGIINEKRFKAGFGAKPISADFAKDLELSVIPISSAAGGDSNSVRFEVKGFIPTQASYDTEAKMYGDFKRNPSKTTDMEVLFFGASPGDWATSVTIDTPAGPRTLTNWTGFDQADPTQRLRLIISLDNYFKFSAKVQFYNGTAYVGDNTLISTFETATHAGTTFSKLECTAKTRLFPYHPGFSVLPGTNYTRTDYQGDNQVVIANSRLAEYKRKPEDVRNNISHYDRNLSTMLAGANQPDIFTFPANETAIGGPDISEPPVMVKFGNVILPTGAPAFGTPNALLATDIPPVNTNFFSVPSGFQQSYIGVSSDYNGSNELIFTGIASPRDFPAFNTFAVELENINAKGYITESFTSDNKKSGRGVSSSIIGVVPFTETRGANDDEEYVTLRYSTPYSQPVEVNLPTEQFLYNFNFRLRNIETNEYLKHLLNPTELIMRIQNKM